MSVNSISEKLLLQIKDKLVSLNTSICSLNDTTSDNVIQELQNINNSIQSLLDINIRTHDNFEVTGTSPLIIAQGAISLTVVKDSAEGEVIISGNNGNNYTLRIEGENFSEGIDERVSVLSTYTITGSTSLTRFKVHLIK